MAGGETTGYRPENWRACSGAGFQQGEVELQVDAIGADDSRRDRRGTFIRVESPGEVIYQVHAESVSTHRASRSSSRESIYTAAWTIADLLRAETTADDLLSAIETAIELEGEVEQPAKVRFHKQTNLIIARGSQSQITTINRLMEQLRESAGFRESAAARSRLVEIERKIVSLDDNHKLLSGYWQQMVVTRQGKMKEPEFNMRTMVQDLLQTAGELRESARSLHKEYDRISWENTDEESGPENEESDD